MATGSPSWRVDINNTCATIHRLLIGRGSLPKLADTVPWAASSIASCVTRSPTRPDRAACYIAATPIIWANNRGASLWPVWNPLQLSLC